MTDPIRIYEHKYLRVGTQNFTEKHFNLLVQYNEQNDNNLFTVGLNKIKFTSYVGVIQVKDLVIEVLPKGDQSSDSGSKDKWRSALITMLSECKKLKLKSFSKADLKLKKHTLLDLYIEHFLNEVKSILHKGLIKKYRQEEGQVKSLKGRLHLPKHISKNYIHKERLYTVHQKYDYNHSLNQILKVALQLLSRVSLSPILAGITKNLLLRMEEVNSIPPYQINFDTIHYSRRTNHYREAIDLARLIIEELSPQLSHGYDHVLAFLFDMNTLFEEFIYRRLKKEEAYFIQFNLKVKKQPTKRFWQSRPIQPDIVLSYEQEGIKHKCIIDTKWKLLKLASPSSDDLKQMFTYNLYFDSHRSILLYPNPGLQNGPFKKFARSSARPKYNHGLEVRFVEPFIKDGSIDPAFAKNFLMDVINDHQKISNSIATN